MKRSRASLNSLVLARLVVELHIAKGGASPAQARDLVILEWLSSGDTEPFNAWSREGVGPDVLDLIAGMIRGDDDLPFHLVVKRHRGAPPKAGNHWRDVIIAQVYYKQRETLSAEAALVETAAALGVSESTVRGALKRYSGFEKSAAQRKAKRLSN